MINIDSCFIVSNNYRIENDSDFLKNGLHFYENSELNMKMDYNKINSTHALDEFDKLMKEKLDKIVNNTVLKDRNPRALGSVKYIVTEEIFHNSSKTDKDVFTVNQVKKYKFIDYYNVFFTELYKVDYFNFKSLMKFTDLWGTLAGFTSLDIHDSANLHVLITPIDELLDKIREYQNIYNNFHIINHPRYDYQDGYLIDELENFLLSKNNFRSKLIFEESTNKAFQQVVFEDMFDYAYHALITHVQRDTKLNVCEYCDSLFVPKRSNQKFCSALPGRLRSSCDRAYHNSK